MWIYDSPIGRITIVYDSRTNRFLLVFGNTVYGSYYSAMAAADDVYTFSTGNFDWDQHMIDLEYQLSTPSDISEWTRLS